MVTGVPPQYNVNEYVASKNNHWKIIVRALKKRRYKNVKRYKQYRSSDELPNDVKDLIHDLTHHDSRKRSTVRYATSHPWIVSDVTRSMCGETDVNGTISHGGPIVYLECAKRTE